MSFFVAKRVAFIAAVAVAVGACSPKSSAAPQGRVESPPAASATAVEASTPAQPVGTLNGRVLPDFATLVEQVGPAVVNVSVVEKAHRVANSERGNNDDEDPYQEFFRRFGIPTPDGGQGGNRRYEIRAPGRGPGFIVSADGYILTNAHVVADADEVTVRMTDRREYPAKVIGVDRRTDGGDQDRRQESSGARGDPSTAPGEWVRHRFAFTPKTRDRGHRQRHRPLDAGRGQ
jgi:serine protease Do